MLKADLANNAAAYGLSKADVDTLFAPARDSIQETGGIFNETAAQWPAIMQTNTTRAAENLQTGLAVMPTATQTIATQTAGTLQTGLSGMAPAATAAANQTTAAIETAGTDWGRVILESIWNGILRGVDAVGPGLGGIFEKWGGLLNPSGNFSTGPSIFPVGSFPAGGRVARDGMALLHEGDWIGSSYSDGTRRGNSPSRRDGGGMVIKELNVYTTAPTLRDVGTDVRRDLARRSRS